MFINQNQLTFVRSERIKGTSKKTGNDYDLANVTISDGLESLKLPLEPSLCENENFQNLRKGDAVTVVIDLVERFNRVDFVVISVVSIKK